MKIYKKRKKMQKFCKKCDFYVNFYDFWSKI